MLIGRFGFQFSSWRADSILQPSKLMRFIITRVFGFKGLDESESKPIMVWALIFAITAVALRLFFWDYTGRVWEDTLITVQHSENCALGLGLTHHPSEPRVHGFTSPLSVLVPLLADIFHVGWGIPFIKIVSVFCGVMAIFYVMAIAIHPLTRLSTPAAVLVMGFAAIEHHQIFFGMSGMETQMVILILLMSFYYIAAELPIHLGVSLGLCMLARPDFGFWTVIVGLYLLIVRPRLLPRVVLSAFCVYGPWLLFTTLYYGSPLPNTILAKMLGHKLWLKDEHLTWSVAKRTIVDNLTYSVFAQTGPSHLGHSLWRGSFFWDRHVVSWMVVFFSGIGAVGNLLRKKWALIPPCCFVFLYAIYYCCFVPVLFPWYFPPLATATVLLGAYGLDLSLSRLKLFRLGTLILWCCATAYLGLLAYVLPITFRAEKTVQELIENGVRKRIGLYLAGRMNEDQTLGCEPLGYVGYYSRKTIYDFPGMGSKKVTDFLRSHPEQRNMNGVFEHFKPDFLLLRPWEYEELRDPKHGGWIDRDYEVERTFETAKDAPQWIKDDYAARFILLRKKVSNGEVNEVEKVRS
jgi:hypothetical protein